MPNEIQAKRSFQSAPTRHQAGTHMSSYTHADCSSRYRMSSLLWHLLIFRHPESLKTIIVWLRSVQLLSFFNPTWHQDLSSAWSNHQLFVYPASDFQVWTLTSCISRVYLVLQVSFEGLRLHLTCWPCHQSFVLKSSSRPFKYLLLL